MQFNQNESDLEEKYYNKWELPSVQKEINSWRCVCSKAFMARKIGIIYLVKLKPKDQYQWSNQ